ncbi:MAG: TerC family protein [Bacteroidota bacterium]
MLEALLTPEALISLVTLTFMEIVLGIDNIVFISIVAAKLPVEQQARARNLGLGLALVFRLILLMGIKWIVGLTDPVLSFDLSMLGGPEAFGLSWRDIILIVGGLFLLYKSVSEMHEKLEGAGREANADGKKRSFSGVIVQILLLDIVFSFDSILTAVGLADEIIIMVIAVIIALIVMMVFASRISNFINQHPTMKMLALSFLLLIGFMLVIEGLHQHVPKGYIYFAMAFSFTVELLNMRMRKANKPPVELRQKMDADQ